MKRIGIVVTLPRLITVLLVMVGSGVFGVHYLNTSSAATYSSNPVGNADSCALVNNSTVLYGWAYDPEAPAGAQPYVNVTVGGTTTKVASNVVNYRPTPINSYIDSHYPGAPKPGTYGWTLTLSGLYKGTTNVVSGTVLNYSTGADVALGVNSSGNVDGDTSKPYFTSAKAIPAACLATKPVTPPPPAPPPAPTPPPTPTPTPTPTPVPTPSPTPTPQPLAQAPKTATPVVAPPSNAADGTVTAGTTGATITVPADGASQAFVTYGDTATPDNGSSTLQFLGSSLSFTVGGLDAKSTHYYTITRLNNDGISAVSDSKSFQTLGFVIKLHFETEQHKSVPDINVAIKNADGSNTDSSISDNNGDTQFGDLADDIYTISFTRDGKEYKQTLDTSKTPADQPVDQVAELTSIINVDKLASTSKKPATNPTTKKYEEIAIVAGSAILLIIIITFIRGRWKAHVELQRHIAISPLPTAGTQPEPAMYTAPFVPQPQIPVAPMPAPMPPAAPPPLPPQPQPAPPKVPRRRAPKIPPAVPPAAPPPIAPPMVTQAPARPTVPGSQPAHMGESLKEMVLKSMREEAARRKDTPPPPHVPGGR